jgi:hypothetical protein
MSPLVAMIRKRALAAGLWQALFVLSVVGGYACVQLTVREEHRRMKFVAMDSRDTFYLTNMGSFENAKQIHAELAKMAAETIYSRSPEGFDFPERMERLFNPACFDILQEQQKRESDAFKAMQIHEKWESGEIKELSIDDNTVLVSVAGQVLKVSTFNGRINNESKPVTLFLKLVVNPDMGHNGRFPLIVTHFDQKKS